MLRRPERGAPEPAPARDAGPRQPPAQDVARGVGGGQGGRRQTEAVRARARAAAHRAGGLRGAQRHGARLRRRARTARALAARRVAAPRPAPAAAGRRGAPPPAPPPPPPPAGPLRQRRPEEAGPAPGRGHPRGFLPTERLPSDFNFSHHFIHCVSMFGGFSCFPLVRVHSFVDFLHLLIQDLFLGMVSQRSTKSPPSLSLYIYF